MRLAVIIVDDPKPTEDRQKMRDWFNKTIESRGAVDTVKRVVIVSRLHNGDKVGFTQEQHD